MNCQSLVAAVSFDAFAKPFCYAELYVTGKLGRAIKEAIDALAEAKECFTGRRVLLKPNWVHENNQSALGEACLYTQREFVLAALQEVLSRAPDQVVIGDAPIQSCEFDAIVTSGFLAAVQELSKRFEIPVHVKDFRRTIASKGGLANGVVGGHGKNEDYVLYNLGHDSLLESVTSSKAKFRVTNYDPRKLAEAHCSGKHQYLLARDAIEAEVVLSLPKLKTHQKAGLTAALKNLVGINGSKDFLPHHRVGSPREGGDCYATSSFANTIFETLLDRANQNIGGSAYTRWLRLANLFGRGLTRPEEGGLVGGWHGNDTVWRMTLDLNRILLYGQRDGTMSEHRQRRVLSLTDAIICGEGEGPLSPSPKPLGLVTLAESSAAADFVHATLMGFDPQKIPLVREAFGLFRWPLVEQSTSVIVKLSGQHITPEQLSVTLGADFLAPKGWQGFIERQLVSESTTGS